jgi:hypothetical protein
MAQSNMQLNNIVVYRGDDFGMELTFTDTDGAIIDITGWTFFLTVKKHKEDTDAEAVISVDAAPTLPLTGVMQIVVPHEQTFPLLGTYYYDIQYTKADQTIQTLTQGGITFKEDITQRSQ